MLAGCSGGDSETDTAAATDPPTATSSATTTETRTPTATATATATETPTATPTVTEEPLPSVDEFEYADGASVDGLSRGLVSGHTDSVTDAGSVTITETGSRTSDGRSSSLDVTTRISSDGVLRERTSGDLTEEHWASTARSNAYVRMDAGFEERYRIDSTGPTPDQALGGDRLGFLIEAGAWGGPTEIAERDGVPVARYEASTAADDRAALRVLPGDSLEAFEATLTLSQAGYVVQYEYESTVARDDRTVTVSRTVTFDDLGGTDVSEPDWFDTAAEEGYEFDTELVEDGTVLRLDVTNGPSFADVRAQLSTDGAFATGRIAESVSEGDTVYLSYTGDGSLTYGIDELPDQRSEFVRFLFVGLRDGPFTLLERDIQI